MKIIKGLVYTDKQYIEILERIINKAIDYMNDTFEYDKNVNGYLVSSEIVVKLLTILKGEEK